MKELENLVIFMFGKIANIAKQDVNKLQIILKKQIKDQRKTINKIEK
jgi:hypothetical protein